MAEDVRADVEDDADVDAACELPGTEPTMLPRAPPVRLEMGVEGGGEEMPEQEERTPEALGSGTAVELGCRTVDGR